MVFNLKQYRLGLNLVGNIDTPPFCVFYTGQMREWYGDDDMKVGRYKNKGQGGAV